MGRLREAQGEGGDINKIFYWLEGELAMQLWRLSPSCVHCTGCVGWWQLLESGGVWLLHFLFVRKHIGPLFFWFSSLMEPKGEAVSTDRRWRTGHQAQDEYGGTKIMVWSVHGLVHFWDVAHVHKMSAFSIRTVPRTPNTITMRMCRLLHNTQTNIYNNPAHKNSTPMGASSCPTWGAKELNSNVVCSMISDNILQSKMERAHHNISPSRPGLVSRPILRAMWHMAAYFQRHTKRNRIVKDLLSRRHRLRSIGSQQ